jgi:hypothetical protein
LGEDVLPGDCDGADGVADGDLAGSVRVDRHRAASFIRSIAVSGVGGTTGGPGLLSAFWVDDKRHGSLVQRGGGGLRGAAFGGGWGDAFGDG